MNNDYQQNNNQHNIKNNGYDNDYHRSTPPPPPTQVYDEIHTDRDEEQIPQSPPGEQLISPSTQV